MFVRLPGVPRPHVHGDIKLLRIFDADCPVMLKTNDHIFAFVSEAKDVFVRGNFAGFFAWQAETHGHRATGFGMDQRNFKLALGGTE